MPIAQKEFERQVKRFSEIEDARDQLWDRARNLILHGYDIEAYVLILATWNFARFRYFMKKFDLRQFATTIKTINPIFLKLAKKRFENTDLSDKNIRNDIKTIYNNLKKIAEQTGASKIMALMNPDLFIMWDTEIRRTYKINNGATSEDYLAFLIKMKEEFGGIRWTNKLKSFAKAIDEYNYVAADSSRGNRKKIKGF